MTGLLVTLVVLQSLQLLCVLSISGSMTKMVKDFGDVAKNALTWTSDIMGVRR